LYLLGISRDDVEAADAEDAQAAAAAQEEPMEARGPGPASG
jgi:hypothetical protein